MIIYKDLITGDDMFTDSFKIKLVDDCIWEVECNYVMRKQGDITFEGLNPSAEEIDEGTIEVTESGYDLVLNHRLAEISFSKNDFKSYIKTYTKMLQEKWKDLEWNEEQIAEAKAKFTEAVKKILPKVNDAQFFLGNSYNPDGTVGILEFRNAEDGTEKAIMNFFKHGLTAERV